MENTFIVTDDCLWEANKRNGTRAPHAIMVVDENTGQSRLIKSGSRIRFVSGEITEPKTQESYNSQAETPNQ